MLLFLIALNRKCFGDKRFDRLVVANIKELCVITDIQ